MLLRSQREVDEWAQYTVWRSLRARLNHIPLAGWLWNIIGPQDREAMREASDQLMSRLPADVQRMLRP